MHSTNYRENIVLRAKGLWRKFRGFRDWESRGYSLPVPRDVKEAVILRNGIAGGTWIETGTHLGDTAELLATVADQVHTIEPAKELFEKARIRLSHLRNVIVHLGTSEDTLEPILQKTQGNVTFWLDGHYSAGVTFKGKSDTPILEELNLIAKYRSQFQGIAVLIDDVRCFNPQLTEFSEYPAKAFLVNWSLEQKLAWTIEHDIFIARSFN